MKFALLFFIVATPVWGADQKEKMGKMETSSFKVESLDGKTLYYNVDQTINYTANGKIDKMTKYFDPAKKLAQTEHSISDFESLKLELFDFDNLELGAQIDVKTTGDQMTVRVLEKKGEKVKEGKMTWSKNMLFSKSISYFIERNWAELQAKKSFELDMFVPAKLRSVSFKLSKTGESDGLVVLRLEPASFFIRQFVDPMDFYYRDGKVPKMVRFTGRTTIPIKGNGDLVVRLNFE